MQTGYFKPVDSQLSFRLAHEGGRKKKGKIKSLFLCTLALHLVCWTLNGVFKMSKMQKRTKLSCLTHPCWPCLGVTAQQSAPSPSASHLCFPDRCEEEKEPIIKDETQQVETCLIPLAGLSKHGCSSAVFFVFWFFFFVFSFSKR